MTFADYSKVDSTPQERDHIAAHSSYELWLLRIILATGDDYGRLAGHLCKKPLIDVLVAIEIMKPGVTSIAADLDNPNDLIGDDRMEVVVQNSRPRWE